MIKNIKNIRKASRSLFCVYIVAVVLLCVIHTSNIPELPKSFFGIPIDKIAHFIMFLPFVILSYTSFAPEGKGIGRKIAVLAILLLLGCIFAFSTEKLQAMTAYRSYEIMDMVADATGLACGSLITLAYIIKTR